MCLTLLVGCVKDAEAAFSTGLIRPHADDAQRGNQHDVVGHRGTELALQVFHRTEMRQDETRIHRLLLSTMVIGCALIIHIIVQRPRAAMMKNSFSSPYRNFIFLLSGYNKLDCWGANISLQPIVANDSILSIFQDIKYGFLNHDFNILLSLD